MLVGTFAEIIERCAECEEALFTPPQQTAVAQVLLVLLKESFERRDERKEEDEEDEEDEEQAQEEAEREESLVQNLVQTVGALLKVHRSTCLPVLKDQGLMGVFTAMCAIPNRCDGRGTAVTSRDSRRRPPTAVT